MLPDVIFLYGPAGSGKGTQAYKILEEYPELIQLDYGKELREFNTKHLKEVSENGDLARRMHGNMEGGNPVFPEDLEVFIKNRIKTYLDAGSKVLIDGAWRTVGEAIWLANFLNDEGAKSVLFQIHISQEEAIKRATGRWLLEGSTKPYMNKTDALKEAKEGQKPYQRYDDKEVDTVIQRYKSMYGNHWAKVIYQYQSVTKNRHYVIDGEKDAEAVFNNILNYLRETNENI